MKAIPCRVIRDQRANFQRPAVNYAFKGSLSERNGTPIASGLAHSMCAIIMLAGTIAVSTVSIPHQNLVQALSLQIRDHAFGGRITHWDKQHGAFILRTMEQLDQEIHRAGRMRE